MLSSESGQMVMKELVKQVHDEMLNQEGFEKEALDEIFNSSGG